MQELILVGKTIALCGSLAGLYFSLKQEWRKSSVAWNGVAAILWLVSLA